MRVAIVLGCVSLLAACSVEPGSEKWCAQMDETSKSEWTMDDAKTYASRCVIDSRTIGSEEWCAKLDEKDKGEWTTSEAADYAKHCVM